MTWRHYLKIKTRTPAFLWRLVIGILAIGIVGGMLVEGRLAPALRIAELSPEDRPALVAEALAELGQWADLWWYLPKVVFRRVHNVGPTALALFAGAWWLAFAVQAAAPRGRRDVHWWLLPLAVVLGGLSVWPTHFLGMWLEHRWGIAESDKLVEGVRFYILGVGLPEEAAKLLCFLPLVVILRRVRSDLTAMMAAACVGLGFAIVENINYFQMSGGSAAVGRFLTANPLHMTLTGLAGLAAYRAARDPRGWGPNSFAMIALMVFAHGLYDALIAVPELQEVDIGNVIIFALVIYQFFRELRDMRPPRREMISLSATFLTGVSMVTAATFIYTSGLFGFQPACDTMAMNVLSLSLMAYLFLREMPDTMVTV
jgi:RsiW-degrading membrane proteinase PrsW (M82 family)